MQTKLHIRINIKFSLQNFKKCFNGWVIIDWHFLDRIAKTQIDFYEISMRIMALNVQFCNILEQFFKTKSVYVYFKISVLKFLTLLTSCCKTFQVSVTPLYPCLSKFFIPDSMLASINIPTFRKVWSFRPLFIFNVGRVYEEECDSCSDDHFKDQQILQFTMMIRAAQPNDYSYLPDDDN